MFLTLKGSLQLALGAFVSASLFQGCGGLDPGTVNLVSDASAGKGSVMSGAGRANAGSTGTPEGGAASGGEGDQPMSVAGDAAGGAPSLCVDGSACQDGPEAGICVDGACATCQDVTDDAKCARAYGKGYLCVQSGCSKAECRVDRDCKNGGTCANHACTSCTKDDDCAAPATICNVTSGVCVTNASCGNAVNGAPCPANAADRCCASSGICAAVACCGVSPCKTSATAATNDGTCKNGQCVLAGCTAPLGTTRYVAFDAADGGSGSQACPFNKLGAALKDLGDAGGTVIVKAGTSTVIDATFPLGVGVNIVGSDGNFAACTKDTCPDPKTWPAIKNGNRRMLNVIGAGTRLLHFLRLEGVDAADKASATWAGIYVADATLNLDHVDVSGYQYGIYSDNGGLVNVGGGVRAHHNHDGVFVADGGDQVGGSMVISVVSDATSFDHNDFGIVCHGNGTLKLSGPPSGPQLPALISANANGGSGVYWPASVNSGLIDGLEAANNGTDATQGQRDGATIFAHANVKVRNSYFHDNRGDGIHIPGNGQNSTSGLSKIDLGLNLAGGAGRNTFVGNTGAGICVEAGPATAAAPNSLHAQGNVFRTSGGDCTVDGAQYVRGETCSGGVDYAGACAGAADLSGCKIKPSTACD